MHRRKKHANYLTDSLQNYSYHIIIIYGYKDEEFDTCQNKIHLYS